LNQYLTTCALRTLQTLEQHRFTDRRALAQHRAPFRIDPVMTAGALIRGAAREALRTEVFR
jgi:hypothetical protein